MNNTIVPIRTTTPEPQPFDFNGQQVRVVMDEDKPWFVATDVARILGYDHTPSMVRTLDDKHKGVRPVHTLGGDQEMTVISEPGLWKACAQRQTGRMVDDARRAFIEAFQDWVFEDVIPQIRKTGSYGQPKELTADEIVEQALQITARRVEELKAHVAVIEPKANAWERFCSSTGDMSASEAAKALARAGLNIGGLHKLYAICDAKKEDGGLAWFFRNGHGQREAYQRVVDQGLIRMKSGSYENSKSGEQVATITPRFTPKALDALAKHLKDAA